jgi:hypothetical protein
MPNYVATTSLLGSNFPFLNSAGTEGNPARGKLRYFAIIAQLYFFSALGYPHSK